MVPPAPPPPAVQLPRPKTVPLAPTSLLAPQPSRFFPSAAEDASHTPPSALGFAAQVELPDCRRLRPWKHQLHRYRARWSGRPELCLVSLSYAARWAVVVP